jgi:hypothetical protein
MSNKIHSEEVVNDGNKLSKYLVDFKNYIDSKKCVSSGPLNHAEITKSEPKVAYQCKMKILMEERGLSWSEKPTKQRVNHSIKPIFDIWTDYQFQLADKRFEQKRPLPEHDYTTDCETCQGQGTIQCNNHRCNHGTETCLECTEGRKSDGSRCSHCKDGLIECKTCNGRGRVGCIKCDSCGAFLHSVILYVSWEIRTSTWYYQNSFLPEEIIAQTNKISLWSKSETPWTKDSSIEDFLQSLNEPNSAISLKTNLIKDYKEKHLNETLKLKNQMRRLICDIERLDFQEIEYTLEPKYLNKRDPTKGKYSLIIILISLASLKQVIDFVFVNILMYKDVI